MSQIKWPQLGRGKICPVTRSAQFFFDIDQLGDMRDLAVLVFDGGCEFLDPIGASGGPERLRPAITASSLSASRTPAAAFLRKSTGMSR